MNPGDLVLQPHVSLHSLTHPQQRVPHAARFIGKAVRSVLFYVITVSPDPLRMQRTSARAVAIVHVCNGISALHAPAARNTAPRLPPGGESPAQQLPDPSLQVVFIQQFLLKRFSSGKSFPSRVSPLHLF